MRIAIIGASGFIGSALTSTLLATTEHDLVLFSHRATKLTFTPQQERRIRHIDGSVLDAKDITAALAGCEMAIYLVHLMGNPAHDGSFSSREQTAAQNFATAAKEQGVGRVIYVGGMGGADQTLTPHLQSRQQTGEIIRATVDQLIEIRTPMVIGQGGAGFEVLQAIVLKWPFFPLPRWAQSTTQPITLADVVRYVAAATDLKIMGHLNFAIGGPERLSYAEVAKRIAAFHHKRIIVIPMPFVSKHMALLSMRFIAPREYVQTVSDMIASAGYSTPQIGDEARNLLPAITPEPIETAFGHSNKN